VRRTVKVVSLNPNARNLLRFRGLAIVLIRAECQLRVAKLVVRGQRRRIASGSETRYPDLDVNDVQISPAKRESEGLEPDAHGRSDDRPMGESA
jgi:hypothetical protein